MPAKARNAQNMRGAALLGAALLVSHALLLWPLLHAASHRPDLTLTQVTWKRTETAGLRFHARVEPRSLARRAVAHRQRAPQQTAPPQDGAVSLLFEAQQRPQLDAACVALTHGGGRKRRVCGAVMTGPLAPLHEPARGALRIVIPQALIADLGPIAQKALQTALNDKIPASLRATLQPKSLTLTLSIAESGVVANARALLPDGTKADATVTLGLVLGAPDSKGRSRLVGRTAETHVHLSGPLADKAKSVGASLGATIGKWLGDEAGRALGEQLGRSVVGAALEGGLRAALDFVVDKEVVPSLSEALSLPALLDLGESVGGAKVNLAWSAGTAGARYVPNKALQLSLDFAIPHENTGAAQRPTPPLADDPHRGWARLALAPPDTLAAVTSSAPRTIVVDVSPDLANALLSGLWRGGQLARLANTPKELSAWDTRLADLSHRPTELRFLRPPHLESPAPEMLDLLVGDLELALAPRERHPGEPTLQARILSRQHLHFGFDATTRDLLVDARTETLELTCVEDTPTGARWRPCFADAVRLAREELRQASGPVLNLVRLPLDSVNPLLRPTPVGGVPIALQTGAVRVEAVGHHVRLRIDAAWK